MTAYEFSLKQEVLMEKAAGILAGIFHYKHERGIETNDLKHPVEAMYTLVWQAKQNVLCAENMEDLIRIDAEVEMGRRFLKIISK